MFYDSFNLKWVGRGVRGLRMGRWIIEIGLIISDFD